jgi:putative Mg2+ transporter-C (MgtC) family protein
VPDIVTAFDPGLFGRLLLAALLGGIVGLDRELSGKPAGLRTNLLICVGAALLTDISIHVAHMANVENVAAGSIFRADPARIAAQIVSGIGFLGAGTILQARGNIIGLTTAATIWVVAGIGMAVGAQAYLQAIVATIVVFVALTGLGRLEVFFSRRRGRRRYIVTLSPSADAVAEVDDLLRRQGLRVESAGIEKHEDRFEATFETTGRMDAHELAARLIIGREDVLKLNRVV